MSADPGANRLPMRLWTRWAALWAGTEHPRTLGLVRILLGSVILWDFLEIGRLGLVVPLMAGPDAGGLSVAVTRGEPPWFVAVFGGSAAAAYGLYAILVGSCAAFVAGAGTRAAAAVLLLAWAQFARILPAADRGIDTLCRDVLLVYVFAAGGAWASVDARLRTGSWWGDGAPAPAWPRKLLILQLVAMYFLAGVQKSGIHWYPPGHLAALYFILQDPAIARYDFRWLGGQPWFALTQLGTAGTLVFQDSYPIVLVLRWLRATAERGGRLRAFAVRHPRLEWLWIGTGALFHVSLAVTCELGIFPFAMLALYPAWVHPDALGAFFRRLTFAARPASDPR